MDQTDFYIQQLNLTNVRSTKYRNSFYKMYNSFYKILTTFFCFSLHRLTPRQASWYHLGRISGLFSGSWEEFFGDYCQGRAPPIETFSSEVRHSKVKEDLLHSVSERISSALIIQKGKVSKIKGAPDHGTRLTNTKREAAIGIHPE